MPEQKHLLVVNGARCDHLFDQHLVQDLIKIGFDDPNLQSHKDLEVGTTGKCIAGELKKCPIRHRCESIIVTAVDLPFDLRFAPTIVNPGTASEKSLNNCIKPARWFFSTRAFCESSGLTEWMGVKVEDMSYDPDK